MASRMDAVCAYHLYVAAQQPAPTPTPPSGQMSGRTVELIKADASWLSKIWSAVTRAFAAVVQIFEAWSNWNKSEIAYDLRDPVAHQLADAEDALETAQTDKDYQTVITLAERGIAEETSRIHKKETSEDNPRLNRFKRILVTASELRAKNTEDEEIRLSCHKNIRSYLDAPGRIPTISKQQRDRLASYLTSVSVPSVLTSSTFLSRFPSPTPASSGHSLSSSPSSIVGSPLDGSLSRSTSPTSSDSSLSSSPSSIVESPLNRSLSRSPSPTDRADVSAPFEDSSRNNPSYYVERACDIFDRLKEAGDITSAIQLYQECDALLREGLGKFPNTGLSAHKSFHHICQFFYDKPHYDIYRKVLSESLPTQE